MSFKNNLNLEVGAILNTQNVEKTLKDLDAKIIKTRDYKVDVKIGDNLVKAVRTVNTLTDAYGNLYKQVKLTNAETGAPINIGRGGNTLKSITESVQGIQKLSTEVHKWVNTKGEVQNWSTTVDSSGRTVSTRVKEVIDDMVLLLKDRHTERLCQGICSINGGLVFMDMLTYIERTADQCSNIAMLLLAKDNEEIMKNHHLYLQKLHDTADQSYLAEQENRKEQYLAPLTNIKG